MKLSETDFEVLNFKHLPAYANFLLHNYLEEYARHQLNLSIHLKLPVLKIFNHLTPEQIFEFSKKNSAESLSILSENKVKEHLKDSLQKWENDKHEVIGRFDMVAEDITLINYIRQKGLKKWVLKYSSDSYVIQGLIDEIDDYTFANNTLVTNSYINILTEKLEKKSNQLLEAQSIAQIGSFEWNFNNISRDNSPELRKIFETDQAQSYEDMLEKVHPADKERVRQAVERSLKEGKYDCEFKYIVGNKEKVLWTKAIIHYENGKPVLMTGTVQDITERKKIEQKLLQQTYELEVSNSSLEKFAFVASHDLQEPLRKILMHTDLLLATEKQLLSDKGKTLLEKISGSTLRMKSLIKDILTYSTINPQREKQEIELEEILQEVKNELEHTIAKTNASITSDNLPSAVVFPFQIKQLFQNIISNSIKFSKKDISPIINISHSFLNSKPANLRDGENASRYLQIQIADNGIGFEKGNANEIFSLFKRLHSQKEFEGSGLGLAICKKVVENHGGIIEAAGEKNIGSTFTIVLPQ